MQKKLGVNHSKYESFHGTNTHTQNKCKYILNVYKKHALQKNRSFLLNKRRETEITQAISFKRSNYDDGIIKN